MPYGRGHIASRNGHFIPSDIIIYFEKVNFFHARDAWLELDVCPDMHIFLKTFKQKISQI